MQNPGMNSRVEVASKAPCFPHFLCSASRVSCSDQLSATLPSFSEADSVGVKRDRYVAMRSRDEQCPAVGRLRDTCGLEGEIGLLFDFALG